MTIPLTLNSIEIYSSDIVLLYPTTDTCHLHSLILNIREEARLGIPAFSQLQEAINLSQTLLQQRDSHILGLLNFLLEDLMSTYTRHFPIEYMVHVYMPENK